MKAGDMVAAVTQAIGVKPCEACKERQRKLNEASDALARMFGVKAPEAEPKRGEP